MNNNNRLMELNPTKERFSFREMEHISINYAIHCLKGYDGSFREWYFGVKNDWRNWLKKKDYEKYENIY